MGRWFCNIGKHGLARCSISIKIYHGYIINHIDLSSRAFKTTSPITLSSTNHNPTFWESVGPTTVTGHLDPAICNPSVPFSCPLPHSCHKTPVNRELQVQKLKEISRIRVWKVLCKNGYVWEVLCKNGCVWEVLCNDGCVWEVLCKDACNTSFCKIIT